MHEFKKFWKLLDDYLGNWKQCFFSKVFQNRLRLFNGRKTIQGQLRSTQVKYHFVILKKYRKVRDFDNHVDMPYFFNKHRVKILPSIFLKIGGLFDSIKIHINRHAILPQSCIFSTYEQGYGKYRRKPVLNKCQQSSIESFSACEKEVVSCKPIPLLPSPTKSL